MDRRHKQRGQRSRMGRRLICIVALTVVFLLALSGLAYANVWTDISDATWLSVYQVSAADAFTVAEGYPDGTFRPDRAVTRGQFAKMVADGLDIPLYNPSTPSFSDVAPSYIFYQYIEGSVAAGVISGYPDGTFRPENNIVRQQANSILGSWLSQGEIAALGGIQGSAGFYASLAAWYAAEGEGVLSGFADRLSIQPVHRPATAYLVMRGVVLGSHSGAATYLMPLSELTRAQAVTMILRTRNVVFERTNLHLSVTGISNPSVAGVASNVTVTVVDQSDVVVPSYRGTIRFSSTDPYPATLPAEYTFTALDAGAHTFTGGVILKTAGAQTVIATDTVTGTITGSQTVTVNPGAASKVFIENAATSAGVALDATTVVSGSHITGYANTHDQYGNFVANVAATWSLSNLVPTTGGVVAGDLVPAISIPSASAVFTGHLAGTCKINAAVTGLTSGVTGTITVSAGTATKILIENAATSAGIPIDATTVASGSHITVYANSHDQSGNFVANVAATWSLSSLDPTTGAVAAGDLVAAGGLKSAVFTGHLAGTCKINAAASGLTSGITGTVTVGPGAATKLVFTTSPSASTAAGTAFAVPPVVTIQDALGNTVTGATTSIKLAFKSGTNGEDATLAGTTTVAAVAGVATFDDLTVNRVGSYQLTATGASLTSATSTAFSITPKPITGTFTVAASKVYDGTTDATVTARYLTGVIGTDDVTLTGGTATYATVDVGSAIVVTLTGATLAGTDKANYTLSSVATTAAAITAKPLTGSFTVAASKVYDASTSATVTDRALTGVIGTDVVTPSGGNARYDTKNVGAGKTVTLTGMTLIGADAGNYRLASVGTTTADITPKPITVTADSGQSKVVGEDDPIFTYAAPGLEPGDSFVGALSRVTGEDVGTYAITQGTLANSNYTITFVPADFSILELPED